MPALVVSLYSMVCLLCGVSWHTVRWSRLQQLMVWV